MYREYQKRQEPSGKRPGGCQICTGCGRCVDAGDKMQILMAEEPRCKVELHNEKGIRLVTVDVGTTTVAMQLHRADGSVEKHYAVVNPQTIYGADVISRIQAAENRMQALTMQKLIRNELEKGIAAFKKELSFGESLQIVLAGNTTMIYLLMGWDTAELGRAPFGASHLEAVDTEIAGEPCYIVEGLSAFVGGDITAGIVACGMLENREHTLLVDLGTNGEMVLGNRSRLVACATAAGPAFEGGPNRGIWGADMVSLLAELRRRGLVDETGLLQEPYFACGIRIGGVLVSQASIRALQLAKAATMAGITILEKQFAGEPAVVFLAGGFGYHMKTEDAVTIGLLPGTLGKAAVSAGNTVLKGALEIGRRLIGGEDTRVFPEEQIAIEVLNLAEYPNFQDVYMDSMNLHEKG